MSAADRRKYKLPHIADDGRDYDNRDITIQRLRTEGEELHIAICQAVTLMNVGENRQAHLILRQSLVDFADRREYNNSNEK